VEGDYGSASTMKTDLSRALLGDADEYRGSIDRIDYRRSKHLASGSFEEG
jgi:aminopeptidase-like protein